MSTIRAQKTAGRLQLAAGRRHEQAAEILATSVILSGAKNLGASEINMLRDSSSPAAPQNDIFGDYFSSLLNTSRRGTTRGNGDAERRGKEDRRQNSDLPAASLGH